MFGKVVIKPSGTLTIFLELKFTKPHFQYPLEFYSTAPVLNMTALYRVNCALDVYLIKLAYS